MNGLDHWMDECIMLFLSMPVRLLFILPFSFLFFYFLFFSFLFNLPTSFKTCMLCYALYFILYAVLCSAMPCCAVLCCARITQYTVLELCCAVLCFMLCFELCCAMLC